MLKIYYFHPMELYFSDIEKEDLVFLSRKGIVTNPRDIDLQNMIDYIKLLKEHDVVYYRDLYYSVAFEVLSALAFGIPVYLLETKRRVSKRQLKEIVEVFENSPYFKRNIKRFKTNFLEFYSKFLEVIKISG